MFPITYYKLLISHNNIINFRKSFYNDWLDFSSYDVYVFYCVWVSLKLGNKIVHNVLCLRGLCIYISSPSSLSECSAQGQVLHCKRRNLGCSSAEDSLPPQTQEIRLQFYQGLKRCGSFPLLSASRSLFSVWIDFKRSEKIPGAPTWR